MENTFCRTCEVSFTSQSHAISHYNGKKHKKRVEYSLPRPAGTRRNRSPSLSTSEEAAAAQAPPLTPGTNRSEESSPSPQDYEDPRSPNESGHYYYCSVCSKNFSGPAPMKQHMEGSAHEKQLRKFRKAGSLSKLQDEDLSPQPKQHSTPSNFTRRDILPSPSATTTDSEPVLHRNIPTSSSFAKKPLFTHKPRPQGMRSGRFPSGEMGVVRSELIHMCMEKMKAEIFRVIPIIAESVVDAVLEALPNNKMEPDELRQEENGRMDEAQKEDATSPHQEMVNKEGFSLGDEAEGTSSQSSSSDEEEGLNTRKEAHMEEDPTASDNKTPSPGPLQVGDGPGEGGVGNSGEVADFQAENDLDGPRFSRNRRQNHFSNLGAGGSGCNLEQVESEFNDGQHQGPARRLSYNAVDTLNGDRENMATQFGFSKQEMEECLSSVTSQDLIQLEEPRSEQYHSAVPMATQADTQDGEVYYSAQMTSVSQENHNMASQLYRSGPPRLQQYESYCTSDGRKLNFDPGEPLLEEQTSDVSDLMNVVTDIIRTLDFHTGDGSALNQVPAPPIEGALYSLKAEP